VTSILYARGTYTGEQNKMFEACVKVGLLLKANNFLKMRMIYVGIHTEQPLENCLHHLLEVWRKWGAYKELQRRKQSEYYARDINIILFL